MHRPLDTPRFYDDAPRRQGRRRRDAPRGHEGRRGGRRGAGGGARGAARRCAAVAACPCATLALLGVALVSVARTMRAVDQAAAVAGGGAAPLTGAAGRGSGWRAYEPALLRGTGGAAQGQERAGQAWGGATVDVPQRQDAGSLVRLQRGGAGAGDGDGAGTQLHEAQLQAEAVRDGLSLERADVGAALGSWYTPRVLRDGDGGRYAEGARTVDGGDARQMEQCAEHFGARHFADWADELRPFCAPERRAAADAATGELAGSLECAVTVDGHLPKATAPHVVCLGANVTVTPAKAEPADCPRHRPGYQCSGHESFYHYSRGFLGARCSLAQDACVQRACIALRGEEFPADHLRDVLADGFGAVDLPSRAVQAQATYEHGTALVVTRENGEHKNVFHALTDFINAYASMAYFAGAQASLSEGGYFVNPLGSPLEQPVVLLLDEHEASPFDSAWAAVAAGGGREAATVKDPMAATRVGAASVGMGKPLVRRLSTLKGATTWERLIFVPPGYTSTLFAYVTTDNECPVALRFFQGFRLWFMGRFGRPYAADVAALEDGKLDAPFAVVVGGGAPADYAAVTANSRLGGGDTQLEIHIGYVTRRPFKGKGRVARQVANEKQLMASLERAGLAIQQSSGKQIHIKLSVIDLAGKPLHEQLDIINTMDVMVSMHGAALAYGLLLPPHAGIVEMWPQEGMWRCYEHIAAWAGLSYRRWVNTDPARVKLMPDGGDGTEVDVDTVSAAVAELVVEVIRSKQRAKEEIGARR